MFPGVYTEACIAPGEYLLNAVLTQVPTARVRLRFAVRVGLPSGLYMIAFCSGTVDDINPALP